jgi:hypothetical protein
MSPAEFCLSFDRSMDLTKCAIVLDGCCFCWVRDNDDQQIKLIERSRIDEIDDLKGEVTFLCHAPTVGELLEYLLGLDAVEYAAKIGLRTLAENGRYGSIRISKVHLRFDSDGYLTQMSRPVEAGVSRETIKDALFELAMEVNT